MIFDARLMDMPEPQEAMRHRPLPSELTAGEQRMRAALYREMAATATTRDIQGALLDHLGQSNTPLMNRQPTGFVFEICDPASRWARLDRLVSEYTPFCNQGLAPGRV